MCVAQGQNGNKHDIKSLELDVCTVTESKLNEPQVCSPLLNDYEKLFSPIRRGEGTWWFCPRKAWMYRYVQSF